MTTSSSRDQLSKPFTWYMQDGSPIRVDQMRTSHLFYSLRMVWNHLVPPDYQTPNFRRYNIHLSAAYTKEAVRAMIIELSHRTDLDPSHKEQLDTIMLNARLLMQHEIEMQYDHDTTHGQR